MIDCFPQPKHFFEPTFPNLDWNHQNDIIGEPWVWQSSLGLSFTILICCWIWLWRRPSSITLNVIWIEALDNSHYQPTWLVPISHWWYTHVKLIAEIINEVKSCNIFLSTVILAIWVLMPNCPNQIMISSSLPHLLAFKKWYEFHVQLRYCWACMV